MHLQILNDMSRLHRSRAPGIKDALDAMPGYRETEQRLAALQDYQFPPVVTEPGVVLAGYVADAIREGKPVPKDLIDQATNLAAQSAARNIAADAVQGAVRELASDLDAILREHIAEVYAAIDAHLQGVVDEARYMWPVPLDAADAIRQDRVADFQRWGQLEHQYRNVRSSHQAALSDQGLTVTGKSWIGISIANPDDLWPHLARYETGHRYTNQNLEESYRADSQPPWPENMHTEGLAWLAANPKAQVWVPTRAQYTAVRDAHGQSKIDHSAGVPLSDERRAGKRQLLAQIRFNPDPVVDVMA